jgi:hypothetical protein
MMTFEVIPYHPDLFWDEYQKVPSYENMVKWLKHRAYVRISEEAAGGIP